MMHRRFVQLIEPNGNSMQQSNPLRILRVSGTAGTSTLDIADRMIEMTPGVTRLLDKLEDKRLVRRERCAEDRRQVLCWITESGLRLLSELDKPLAAAGIKSMEPLPSAEQRALIRTLEKIREKIA